MAKTHASPVKNGANPAPDEAATHEDRLTRLGVGFASSDEFQYLGAPGHVRYAAGAFWAAGMGGFIMLLRLLESFALIVSPPGPVIFLIVAVPLAALATWLFIIANRRANREWDARGLIRRAARVRVLSTDWDPERLVEELEAAHHGFEPEIARLPLASGFDTAGKAIAIASGTIGLAIGFAVDRALPSLMTTSFFVPYVMLAFITFFAIAIPEFVFPTYVRIIPGRMDVVRSVCVLDRIWTVASYDLRTERLMMNRAGAYFLDGEDPKPGTMRRIDRAVSLALTRSPKKIELAILKAATTAAPTPAVPHDRLLG